jgi:hypothetical protein
VKPPLVISGGVLLPGCAGFAPAQRLRRPQVTGLRDAAVPDGTTSALPVTGLDEVAHRKGYADGAADPGSRSPRRATPRPPGEIARLRLLIARLGTTNER